MTRFFFLRALREPFNHGEHKGFFTERAKRGGEFLTAEDAEVTELDGEEWFLQMTRFFFLRALREPFNHGEHKGFFTERAKRGGEFLTAEGA
jgi:hypothetical protein